MPPSSPSQGCAHETGEEESSPGGYCLRGVFGNRHLINQISQPIHLPATLLQGPADLIGLAPQENEPFPEADKYPAILRLPVPPVGVILLFTSAAPPAGDIPFQRIFTPVLASFSHTYQAYRSNEIIFSQLQQEVTERRSAQAALLAAKEEAERANKAKSLFLSNMSHELRTPMNAIMGFSQLLELELQEPQLDYVHEISKASHHLLSLIDELLDLSRIEAGTIKLSIASSNISAILKECLALLQPIADKRQIRITAACATHFAVRADTLRLKQVMLNLISNAIKYNHPGGKVNITCEPAENGRIRISVNDSGPGIPPEQLDELFKPFSRLGQEVRGIEGTGIGLVICQKLIHLMQGDIGCNSRLGLGSVFWLELPGSGAESSLHSALMFEAAPPTSPAPPAACSTLKICRPTSRSCAACWPAAKTCNWSTRRAANSVWNMPGALRPT